MNTLKKRLICIFLFFGLPAAFLFQNTADAGGETLSRIMARGDVRCGVSDGVQGFSSKDADGKWSGMDVDFCRALAAAVLGDPEKARFVPLTSAARFPSLKAGEIDVLVRNTTWTMEREAVLEVMFAGILYYDGQGLLVEAKDNVSDISQLSGAAICVIKGSTHEKKLTEQSRYLNLGYQPLIVESQAQAAQALYVGRCKAFSSDQTQLTDVQLKAPGGPKQYVILPEKFSKDPMGPVVRSSDDKWFTVVRWILYTLITAEETGHTRENVKTKMADGEEWSVKRWNELDGIISRALGLQPGWAIRSVEASGNYGEMFERNLGKQSDLKLERGLNRLYTQGGLMYAPPFR